MWLALVRDMALLSVPSKHENDSKNVLSILQKNCQEFKSGALSI